MNCDCGNHSYLSPDEYHAEANEARMACQHCGAPIHFGLAVAALRDQGDPALSNEAVSSLAWYHTSTAADWPSPEFSARFEQDLSWTDRDFGISRERFVAEHTSKALHVGTYETAIENMLRRMSNQGDGRSHFHLYRVSLHLDPRRINFGYRDENHEVAADISVSDLTKEGLDAVRYLNVHEAMGALSLAVRPAAVAAVQSLLIPLNGLAVAADQEFYQAHVDAVESAMVELEEADIAASALDPRERRMMELGARPDPTGVAKLLGKRRNHLYNQWNQLEERLGECFLPQVSAVLRRDFSDALAHWRDEASREDIHDFVKRYRSMAALLERPADVIDTLSQQPWRRITGH